MKKTSHNIINKLKQKMYKTIFSHIFFSIPGSLNFSMGGNVSGQGDLYPLSARTFYMNNQQLQ